MLSGVSSESFSNCFVVTVKQLSILEALRTDEENLVYSWLAAADDAWALPVGSSVFSSGIPTGPSPGPYGQCELDQNTPIAVAD